MTNRYEHRYEYWLLKSSWNYRPTWKRVTLEGVALVLGSLTIAWAVVSVIF